MFEAAHTCAMLGAWDAPGLMVLFMLWLFAPVELVGGCMLRFQKLDPACFKPREMGKVSPYGMGTMDPNTP